MRSSFEVRIGTVDIKYEKGRKKKQMVESHDEAPVPSTSIIELPIISYASEEVSNSDGPYIGSISTSFSIQKEVSLKVYWLQINIR